MTPILAHFEWDKKILVENNTLDLPLVGVLSQYNNEGILHSVAFCSKRTSLPW